MTTEATTDKTAETTDTTKAAETTTQSTTAATTEAAKTADTATTTTETKVANEAVKEFVADPKKSDAENAAALAAFEKADTKAEKPGLPDDWRETAAAGDADLLKLAKRYGSLSGMLKALDESKKALARFLMRLAVRLDRALPFTLTTHEGFYSPCDDEWHCLEVRKTMRSR